MHSPPLRAISATILVLLAAYSSPSLGATFNIVEFGATANDQTDDTTAIEHAFSACDEAGGGVIFIPAGVYLISRRGPESPILETPSNTIIQGEGVASILKFTEAVNAGNFWRMIGAPVATGCRNVVIRDLHLDGSNQHASYVKGATPEHNAGLWFYNKDHAIENVTVKNVFAENFSGDCMAFSYNCSSITIRDCTLKNFLRQGIQMGGSKGSRDYLVSGCRDLEHSVKPGGSTIHVEHARGLKNVIIEHNQCRKSILAGGVDGLIIRGNTIDGRLVGNSNTNLIVSDNVVRGSGSGAVMQFGYTRNLSIRGNIVAGGEGNSSGIYVWGKSRYNENPSESVGIQGNRISSSDTGISLNGVDDVRIQGNLVTAPKPLSAKRATSLIEDLSEIKPDPKTLAPGK